MTHTTPCAPTPAELLPCPFCGGAAHGPSKSNSSDERSGYNFTIMISCSSCDATIIKGSHQNSGGWCDDNGQALAQAIASWNRRALTADASEDAPDAARIRKAARLSLELQIIDSLLSDPDYEYDCGMDADYCTPLTDKVAALVRAARPAPVGAGMAVADQDAFGGPVVLWLDTCVKSDIASVSQAGRTLLDYWQGASPDVEKMLETNELDELGQEVARLQKALCFWLPSITDREDEVADRILQDAFLLCGIDGNIPDDFKTAQELGWVVLAAAPAAPTRPDLASESPETRMDTGFQAGRINLIAAPVSSTPLCPARNTECGQNPQQWCATCPEWEKARSSPMTAPFDEQKLLQLFSTWECLQRGEKGRAAWEAIIAHIKDFRGGDVAEADAGGAVVVAGHPDNTMSWLIEPALPVGTRLIIVHGVQVPRATLEMIYDAMNHMGDQLNEMDVVEPEDEAIAVPAFEAVRELLGRPAEQAKPEAALQALADQAQELGMGYGPDKAEAGEQAGAVDGLTLDQIDDMAFGYAPSGKIGELREFATALLAASATHKGEENG